jgi:hypothetical protein
VVGSKGLDTVKVGDQRQGNESLCVHLCAHVDILAQVLNRKVVLPNDIEKECDIYFR